jgi:hypothetical protein
MDHRLATRTGALRLAFGLTATLAGLDKFFNLLADWSSYISQSPCSGFPCPARPSCTPSASSSA